MKSPEPPVSAMIREMADRLRASFRASETIDHNLTRGEFRERVVEDVLRPHLPARFVFSTGAAVNANGGQSRQQDVLISDAAAFGSFVSAGGISVHPAETVAATIQVKTRLDGREIQDAVENIASLKVLLPPLRRASVRPAEAGEGTEIQREDHRIFGGILAYAASIDAEAVTKAFGDAARRVDPRLRPDGLYVLDGYSLLLGANFRAVEICYPPEAECLHAIAPGDQGLLFFFALLYSALSSYVAPPLDLSSYIRSSGVEFQHTTVVPAEDAAMLMAKRPK
jgi:hypothetical protein